MNSQPPPRSSPTSRARQQLLDRAVAHAAAQGLTDASLRELADAIGTSHRMLIYHFGSRDGLVAAVVAAVEDQQRAALTQLASGSATPRELVLSQWAQLTDPALRPYVVLFFDVVALALRRRPGTERFLHDLTTPWIDLAEQIASDLGAAVSRDDLRAGVAVVRGLLLDLLASGDVAATTAALHRFLDGWDQA